MELNDARMRAAQLCSQQERCSSEIRDKLSGWGLSEKDIASVLEWLVQEKFLDDSRYAKFYVKDKFAINRWGRIKISYMLRQKKISAEHMEEALGQISEEEYLATCIALLKNKLRSIKDTNHLARKAKLMRFASQRGFESEVIYKAIERLSD